MKIFLNCLIAGISASFQMIQPKTNQATMTVPQLIKAHGYPALNYEVVSEDGYKTTLHRIPAARGTKEVTGMK